MNRRTFLLGVLGTPLVLASVRGRATSPAHAGAASSGAPKGKMVLAWHAGIASRWLDPQEHDGTASPDNFTTILHDALIKNQGKVLYDHPALAEHFEFANDAKSATFRLRPGLKFHNGEPVTPADVKFTYEQYRGAKADVLKNMTQGIEVVDDRTVRFHFHRPFLDFPLIFGTANVSGAGWIVPAKYYQQVGPDRFKQQPIGAGPYRLVRQEPGVRLEFEAFTDYYRPVHVKSFTVLSVPEDATRAAMLERQEADIIYLVPGELIDTVRSMSGVMLAPVLSGSWWLQFPGFQNPKNPFHDKRVREAVSLALDRRAINDAETGGMGKPTGNWINDDVQYALTWPEFEPNIPRAKQLMKEAGHANGFDVDWLTPVPNYFSRGERVIAQLREIGIRTRLQVMERGVFLQRMQSGLKEWPGVQIIMNAARIGGSWANWYESMFTCGGFSAKDFFCVQELDAKFAQYQQSIDPAERQRLAEEIQRAILEEYYFVPVFRHAFVNAIGPRIAATTWQDVFQTITTGYAYPWEEIKLKGA
ncbi:MAG: ABC transporter substrate-binding protein [Candidatus Tectomicrobia bacterium]|jgi:ABC-type transport system substrate-binding protein|nr:ABC transporter substrate-binding protein [Candidatus Tectomicrobia bacterium]HEX2277921.1 ABC transporter substrate-binding protein [Candidatus Tectomicrobia bacterium]